MVKDLVRLKDRRGNDANEHFLVEGKRETQRAIKSGFACKHLYFCQDFVTFSTGGDGSQILMHLGASPGSQQIGGMTSLSVEAFNKIATRESSDGILAVFKTRNYRLEDLSEPHPSQPYVVVALEELEKPGNLGAILRTADGAGVRAVVMLGSSVDVWNRHVIRASLGGVFSVPVVCCSSSDFYDWCASRKVHVVAAALDGRATSLFTSDLAKPLAIVLGREATGLSQYWLHKAQTLVQIPMLGLCDSLNVSVAAGVLMYESLRQQKATFGDSQQSQ